VAVVYVDSGTVSDVAGNVSPIPSTPAAVGAGDTLVCVLCHGNNASQAAAAYAPPAGWTLANIVTSANLRQFVYQKDTVDGTEDGVTLTWSVSNGVAASFHNAVIHRYTGGTGLLKAFSSATGATAAVEDAGVTTTVNGDLAINYSAMAAQLLGVAFNGEAGGTWTRVHTYTTSPPRLQHHTAPMAATGTINGGTSSIAALTAWASHGYALAALTSTPQTVTTTGVAALFAFGGTPIICPHGF